MDGRISFVREFYLQSNTVFRGAVKWRGFYIGVSPQKRRRCKKSVPRIKRAGSYGPPLSLSTLPLRNPRRHSLRRVMAALQLLRAANTLDTLPSSTGPRLELMRSETFPTRPTLPLRNYSPAGYQMFRPSKRSFNNGNRSANSDQLNAQLDEQLNISHKRQQQ